MGCHSSLSFILMFPCPDLSIDWHLGPSGTWPCFLSTSLLCGTMFKAQLNFPAQGLDQAFLQGELVPLNAE